MKTKKAKKEPVPAESYTAVVPRTPVTPRQRAFLDAQGPGTFSAKLRRVLDKCIAESGVA